MLRLVLHQLVPSPREKCVVLENIYLVNGNSEGEGQLKRRISKGLGGVHVNNFSSGY